MICAHFFVRVIEFIIVRVQVQFSGYLSLQGLTQLVRYSQSSLGVLSGLEAAKCILRYSVI